LPLPQRKTDGFGAPWELFTDLLLPVGGASRVDAGSGGGGLKKGALSSVDSVLEPTSVTGAHDSSELNIFVQNAAVVEAVEAVMVLAVVQRFGILRWVVMGHLARLSLVSRAADEMHGMISALGRLGSDLCHLHSPTYGINSCHL